jgi:chloramphenicol 3-O-phosphotransferase
VGLRHVRAADLGRKNKTVFTPISWLTSPAVNGDVIILTGPPAAGKTTVAELVASDAAGPTIHLVTDSFYRSIRTGFVLPYLPESRRQNEVVIDAIVAAVTAFARGGYDVVVDGIVGPWFLGPFRAAAERDHLQLSYVVLRPTLEATLSRARERAADELKDVDAITGLYEAFTELDELERHVIDTSDLDESRTAVEVRRAVASARCRLA